MRGEIDVIQGARIGEELVGFLPVGKVTSKVYSIQGRVKDSASSTREKFTKEVPNTGNNKDYSADVSNLGKNNASYNQGLNEKISNKERKVNSSLLGESFGKLGVVVENPNLNISGLRNIMLIGK